MNSIISKSEATDLIKKAITTFSEKDLSKVLAKSGKLKNKYGDLDLDFWIAFEEDKEKETRETMGGGGPR